MDLINDMKCELHGRNDENIEHLFFKFAFSHSCMTNIINLIQIKLVHQDKNWWRSRFSRKAVGKVSKAFLWIITTTITYHIRGARNEAC